MTVGPETVRIRPLHLLLELARLGGGAVLRGLDRARCLDRRAGRGAPRRGLDRGPQRAAAAGHRGAAPSRTPCRSASCSSSCSTRSMFELVSRIPDTITVDTFGWALLARSGGVGRLRRLRHRPRHERRRHVHLRVIRRIARRSGERVETDVPGIVFLEIDGLGLPVLRRAMRDGSAPELARWLAEGSYALTEWETDLSSQTGASQAGILLGSNDGHPGVPLGREGDGHADDVLEAAGLRGDRAAPRDRGRAAPRRRCEPRQPALRRGRPRDPDREPHRRGEDARTPATAHSSRTASTSRGCSCSSPGR